MSGLKQARAWVDGIFYDLRFAFRGLRRDRAFTITAVTMLALALGLNMTVFAVMNTMLFRGFPLVKRNDRLLYIQERNPAKVCCLSYPDFEDWRSHAKSFQGLAFLGGKSITLSEGHGRPYDTFAATMTTNGFRLLGVQPVLGRDFVLADEAPGAPPVAILSYRFWEARFGKRADIVGSTVRINQAPATVIGVMPDGFDFPEQENLWMPLEHTPQLLQRRPGGYMAFGRLADGASAAGARAELETISRRLADSYPATNRDVVPRVDNYSQFFIGPDATVIYGSLWAAAWFVLLIACANLANLALARTLGRSREFSTRIALGAGQWRMARQLLTESTLLAGAGGVLGWWIARWGVNTWATETASRHQVLDYSLDSGAVAYLVGISVAATLLFSLLPIGRLLQLDINGTLKGDARGATQGLRSKYLSAALVAVQMTLSIVLLSGAGVLVRSLLNVVDAPVGVEAPEKVRIGFLRLPRDKYASPDSRVAYFSSLRSRLLAVPGVESVSEANTIPVGNPGNRPLELENRSIGPDGVQGVPVITVGARYFHTVGAPIVAGREFDDHDLPSSPPVAMVNRSFAETFFAGQQPVGKRLRFHLSGKQGDELGEWRTIVGVASNIMQAEPTRQRFVPVAYLPFGQEPAGEEWLFARTREDSPALTAAIRSEVQSLDSDATLEDLQNLKASFGFQRDRMDIEHAEMGRHAAVAPIFALMALLLAAIGLYAVIAHSVRQRTKEIGVRMALGGTSGDIRRLIFREGMLPVVSGLFPGLLVSFAVNRILQSQLVGVSPYDPATFAMASVSLIVVATFACQIPSRRAIRVDPAEVLRHD